MKKLLLFSVLCATFCAALPLHCLEALQSLANFDDQCRDSWPLSSNDSLAVTLPMFCQNNTAENCTVNGVHRIMSQVLTECPNLPNQHKAQLVFLSGQARLLCMQSGNTYCILKAMAIAQAMGPLLEMSAGQGVPKPAMNRSEVELVLKQNCDKGCSYRLTMMSLALRSIITRDQTDPLLLPGLACRAMPDYCLLDFLDTVHELKQNSSAKNLTRLFHRMCSPCFVKIVALLRQLNVSIPFPLPRMEQLCQRTPLGEPCYSAVLQGLNQSQLIDTCAFHGPASVECLNALGMYKNITCCCARTLLPIVPAQYALSLKNLLPPLCPFLKRKHLLIRVFLRNINLTELLARWQSFKSRLQAELAAQFGIPTEDIASLSAGAPAKRAKRADTPDAIITLTVDPQGTSYDLETVSNNIEDAEKNGNNQIASLVDPSLILSPDQSVVVLRADTQLVDDSSSSSKPTSSEKQPINSNAVSAFLKASLTALLALTAVLL